MFLLPSVTRDSPRLVFCMEKVLVEIPVALLQIGQYVSRLDRPWSETPFLFQGFEIESDDDIAQLRSLCSKVHVELTAQLQEELQKHARKSTPPPTDMPEIPDRLADLSYLLATRSQNVPDKDPVPLKDELVSAKRIFGQARQVATDLFHRLKSDGKVDVALMDNVMDSMIESVFRNRDALNWLACMKEKDDYLYNHSLSSAVWALAFGRHLGLDKASLKVIGIGAMLLDIGKTKLSDQLLKKTGKPTPQEWALLQTHVEAGLRLVGAEANKIDPRITQMIATHHERLDGSGYPKQLRNEDIPLVGRIAGIVDSYDAMTSDRHYAKGKSAYEAVLELKKLGGTAFQAELVDLFIQAVGVFPTGTLVELNSGEVGVVIAQHRFRRLRPEIMMILDIDKKVRNEFVVVDLQMREQNNAAGEAPLWIAKGLVPGAYGIDPTEYFL